MHKLIPRAWVKQMKKMLVMLCAILGLTLVTFADTVKTCKISGSSDGATVMASIIEVGDGYVRVELSNDGTTTANVKVGVQKKGHASGSAGPTGAMVAPQQSVVKTIRISAAKSSDSIYDFDITTLSGNRCN